MRLCIASKLKKNHSSLSYKILLYSTIQLFVLQLYWNICNFMNASIISKPFIEFLFNCIFFYAPLWHCISVSTLEKTGSCTVHCSHKDAVLFSLLRKTEFQIWFATRSGGVKRDSVYSWRDLSKRPSVFLIKAFHISAAWNHLSCLFKLSPDSN